MTQIINNEQFRWVVSLFFLLLVSTTLRRGYCAEGSVRISSLIGFTTLTLICVIGLPAIAGVALATYNSERRIFFIAIQLPFYVLFLASMIGGLVYAIAECFPSVRRDSLPAIKHADFKRWTYSIYAIISIGLIALFAMI